MSDGWVSQRRVSLTSRLWMVLAVLAAPGLAFAQDTRIDEGPEQEPGVTSPLAPLTRINPGLLAEPPLLTNVIDGLFERFGDTGTPKDGFYAELSNMITGSGFVSLGPGYRHQLLNDRAFVDASAAVSWRAYNMMQARFEMPDLFDNHFSVGMQTMWQDQTQISYFGIGPNSLQSNESQYQMQSIDTVAYATLRPVPSLALAGEFGFLRRPDILSPGGPFKPSLPTTQQEFPNDPGVSEPFQPNYLHSEVSLTSDTRDRRSRPTSGGLYRAQFTSFVDQSTSIGTFTFRQYESGSPALHSRHAESRLGARASRLDRLERRAERKPGAVLSAAVDWRQQLAAFVRRLPFPRSEPGRWSTRSRAGGSGRISTGPLFLDAGNVRAARPGSESRQDVGGRRHPPPHAEDDVRAIRRRVRRRMAGTSSFARAIHCGCRG